MGTFNGTAGDDKRVGGDDNDVFNMGQGGDDSIRAGGGDDRVNFAASFTAGDTVIGGSGLDVIDLNGDYSTGVVITAAAIQDVEQFTLEAGHTYNLTFDDGDYGLTGSDMFTVAATYYGADPVMHVDASAVTGVKFHFYAGIAADWLAGGSQADYVELIGGGNDTVFGNGGDDQIYCNRSSPGEVSINGGDGDDFIVLDRTFDSKDRIDGGSGKDVVQIQGNAGGLMVLSAKLIAHAEAISLDTFGHYDIRLMNDLADADTDGGVLAVLATSVTSGVTIDGSRETDTSLRLTGGDGDDHLIGGRQADSLEIMGGGADTVEGGKGADTIAVIDGGLGPDDAKDSIDGGTGRDTLQIWDYFGDITVDTSGVRNIETFLLMGQDDLVLGDANVTHAHTLTVDASQADTIWSGVSIDGSAEQDGQLKLIGSGARDTLIGGAGKDIIIGGDLDDTLIGGEGADTFVYSAISQSNNNFRDTILDLTAVDTIDLRAIDANETVDGNQAFKLVDHFTHKAGQLALAYLADGDVTLVSLDIDGDGDADGVISLAGDQSGFHHFVL